uniref:TrmE-type G domain-containing protein n=1 Tax=Glossina morsitans morsitans TaxID=37546 RepID=A0A1B0GDQ1_GLOMM
MFLNRKIVVVAAKRYMSETNATIFALSSAYGKCGVSVIRVSGPHTREALRAIVGKKYDFQARVAYLRPLYKPETTEMIDKGLVLWFPGPSSYTGEDCCEFQVHGSLAVIAALLENLGKLPGLRHAVPGEFTRRAFINNKLDLTEVDGLADLIHAETEAQRKQALMQSSGSLSRLYGNWRKVLIRCAAHLEAYIDFAEDENIEHDVITNLIKDLKAVREQISEHVNDQRRGEMLRDGVRTVIAGAPNVGKSSFLNLVCQREVSIVTEIAGTTRDIIESTHNFGGYPVRFTDTAGLRLTTQDQVELEGIRRAKNCIQQADVIILLLDAWELNKYQVHSKQILDDYLKKHYQELDLRESMLSAPRRVQYVANKIDLLNPEELQIMKKIPELICISCKGDGEFKEFLNSFENLLKELCGVPLAEAPRLSHVRYRQLLEQCVHHITLFLSNYSPEIYKDMAISAQKLRQAIRCIEIITGHVSTDNILDVVFKDFCIGK